MVLARCLCCPCLPGTNRNLKTGAAFTGLVRILRQLHYRSGGAETPAHHTGPQPTRPCVGFFYTRTSSELTDHDKHLFFNLFLIWARKMLSPERSQVSSGPQTNQLLTKIQEDLK